LSLRHLSLRHSSRAAIHNSALQPPRSAESVVCTSGRKCSRGGKARSASNDTAKHHLPAGCPTLLSKWVEITWNWDTYVLLLQYYSCLILNKNYYLLSLLLLLLLLLRSLLLYS
jgi:hypothetical protein